MGNLPLLPRYSCTPMLDRGGPLSLEDSIKMMQEIKENEFVVPFDQLEIWQLALPKLNTGSVLGA